MNMCKELKEAIPVPLRASRNEPRPIYTPQAGGGFIVFSSPGKSIAVPAYDISEITFVHSEAFGRVVVFLRGGLAWTIEGEFKRMRILFDGLVSGSVGTISEERGFRITPPA
jgi:hypothetical protein